MPSTEVWTVGRLLQWTTDYLKQHGSETPRLDAEVLLAKCRGSARIQLYTAFDDVPAAEVLTEFRSLVKRRAAGTPVAYLVGQREFFSLPFFVSPAVLIPRPETEFVLIALLDEIKRGPGLQAPLELADIGTGSGVLAIVAARQLPQARVMAIDLSAEALEVARRNAAALHVESRIQFHQGDLLGSLPPEQTFSHLLSNPPYVMSSEMAQLPVTVRDYEPHLALEAGSDGLAVISRLLPQALERLQPGGCLFLEIGPRLEQPVAQLIAAEPRWQGVTFHKDLAGLVRVAQCRRIG